MSDWTKNLYFPTEVPALCEAFSKLSTPELEHLVLVDLATCWDHQDDQPICNHIVEHLSLFAREEIESRGEIPGF